MGIALKLHFQELFWMASPFPIPKQLALLLFLLIGLIGLGSRLSVSTDLQDALPKTGLLGQSFQDVSNFSLLDTLLIEVDGTGAEPDSLHQAVDTLGSSLKARPEFASVRYRFGLEDGIAIRKAAASHLVILTPEVELQQRLSEEGMRKILEQAQARLASPAGAMMAANLLNDPLDLGGFFTSTMQKSGSDKLILSQGHLLSLDKSRALILARPKAPALGTMPDSPLIAALDEALKTSPLPARWLGSHRFAAEAAATIQTEVNTAVSAGVVLVLLVFAVSFRSLRPILGTILPALLGGAAALAAARIASPVHGIALAFGAALGGMGVDYWIHLYLHGIASGVPSSFSDRLKVGVAALKHLLPAYLISVTATLLSFALLATSTYPVVSDLGIIGIGTCGGALLSILLGGPIAFALLARETDQIPYIPVPEKIPLWLAALAAALIFGLGIAGLGVDFDGDPRALDARLPETAALEREFADRYGGDSTNALLVVEAAEGRFALDILAEAVALVQSLPGITVQSPLNWVPAPAQVVARTRLVEDPELEARFLRVADAAGFEASKLLPGFRASLQTITPTTAETWTQTPGEEFLSRSFSASGSVAAFLRGVTPEAIEHADHELELASLPVRFVYPPNITREGAELIREELITRSGAGLIAVLLFMLIRYRDPARVLAAAFPSLAAAAGTLGTLALLKISLTPASGPALVLVLGVAFDQGLFLVEADTLSREAFLASRAAILVALITAMAGFFGLTFASHPGVYGVGLVVALGICYTFMAAFFIVPALLTPQGRLQAGRLGKKLAFGMAGLIQLDAALSLAGRVEPPPLSSTDTRFKLEEQGGTRRYGPSYLARSQGIWVMKLSGNPTQVGEAMAVLMGEKRLQNEEAMEAELAYRIPNPLARYLLIRGSPLLARVVAPAIPLAYREELSAFAQTGADPLSWVAPLYTRKLCMHAIHDIGQAMVDSPLMECTGFVAGPPRSDNWLLARNWDFGGGKIFDEDKAVVVVAREGAIPFVHVAILGLSGVVSGVNAEGLAVAVLAGASDAPIHPGNPMIFLIRQLLEEARTIEEAIAILNKGKGFVSEGILITDSHSGAILEVTPDSVTRLDAQNGVIALSNHFRGLHAEDAANRLRMAEGTTVARLSRIEELLNSGWLDVAAAIRILQDRKGVGNHPLPDGHEAAINADLASHGVVIDAAEHALYISRYPNLSGGFIRFDLEEILSGNFQGIQTALPDSPETSFRVHQARLLVEEAALLRNPQEALDRLERALLLNPGNEEALIAQGKLLLKLGREEEARVLLRAALQIPPAHARDHRAIQALLEP
jgi:predicted exporter/tetratricopeptide (TPR) repeat protein